MVKIALSCVVTGLVLLLPGLAGAAPEAHLLRIDPRASVVDGAPVLTTVVELVQHKRYTDITSQCAAMTDSAQYKCMADRLEQPQALYERFAFPENNAFFTVTVGETDMPTKFVSKERWGESKSQDGVGTAWLILIDAAATMGSRFDEAKAVAKAFISTMDPQDIVDVMFFDDRTIIADSRWTAQKAVALNFVGSREVTAGRHGRTRPLFNIIKNGATSGFKELGNVGTGVNVPMHQAMVVLSNGQSGADTGSNAQMATALNQYLTKGRFPEDNQTLPKAPVPVISIWFPAREMEEFYQNAQQFMENLANHQIGGFYSIVQQGESERGARIVKSVRTRFDQMHIIKWRVPCIAPAITQTFKLVFKSTNPAIAGDNFLDVPVGIDITTWPLDIDVERTVKSAKKSPIYPGGTIRIFGDFCWGSDHKVAQLYMIPKNQPAPETLKGKSVEDAKNFQRTLVEAGMVGKAVQAGDTYVEFEVPETKKFLSGKKGKMTARLVVFDSTTKRTSAITADKIITVAAQEEPLNLWLIGGATFAGVVLVLLVIQIFRGGGGKRRRAATPPRPTTGPALTPAPGPAMAPAPAPLPGPPMGMGGPPMGMGGPPLGGGAPPFAGGDPMGGGGGPPFGEVPPGGGVGGPINQATLRGQPGIYPVTLGREVKVGRDPGMCDICLTEPRISGLHATVKLEADQLFVRDEGSNNGTFISGGKIPPHTWQVVPDGAVVKFGPIEFNVRLE